MTKFKNFIVWFIVAIFLSFCLYGFWPRLDVINVSQQIGVKYKTIGEFEKKHGLALFRANTILDGSTVEGYVYVNRYIFPRYFFVFYTDIQGKAIKGAYETLKNQIFYFPDDSPLMYLMTIELMIRSNFFSGNLDEIENIKRKLLPKISKAAYQRIVKSYKPFA